VTTEDKYFAQGKERQNGDNCLNLFLCRFPRLGLDAIEDGSAAAIDPWWCSCRGISPREAAEAKVASAIFAGSPTLE